MDRHNAVRIVKVVFDAKGSLVLFREGLAAGETPEAPQAITVLPKTLGFRFAIWGNSYSYQQALAVPCVYEIKQALAVFKEKVE